METRQIEFEKLKHAYLTVKSFIEEESFEKVKSLDTKVYVDLALSGDDNYDMLVKFVKKFELDHKNFDYTKHFHTEGELFSDSGIALEYFLTLSVWLPLKTIELLTLNKLKFNKPEFKTLDNNRVVSDLTFKDMITWYIEKEFIPSNQIKYEIKK